MDASLIVMDEKAGRRIAQQLGLSVTGTIGILDLAACSPRVRALVGVLDGAEGGERVEQARDVPPTGAVDGAAWIEGKAMARLRGLQKLLGTGDKPACLFDPRTHLVRIRCKQLIIALLPAVLHDRREACIEMTPISLHTSDVAGN
jgi:hypothetical protein